MTAVLLSSLRPGTRARVAQVLAARDSHDRELALRLIEIGFLPGEPVRVVARGQPGDEPIAVRLGQTTFALRRFEAALVTVHEA